MIDTTNSAAIGGGSSDANQEGIGPGKPEGDGYIATDDFPLGKACDLSEGPCEACQ